MIAGRSGLEIALVLAVGMNFATGYNMFDVWNSFSVGQGMNLYQQTSTTPILLLGLLKSGAGAVLQISACTAPSTPAAGLFYLYMDTSDSKFKCKGPSGTVTTLGNP